MSDENKDDVKLARRRLLRNLGLGLGAAYLAPVIVGIDAAEAQGFSFPGGNMPGRRKASRPSRPGRPNRKRNKNRRRNVSRASRPSRGRRARVRRRARASRPSRPSR